MTISRSSEAQLTSAYSSLLISLHLASSSSFSCPLPSPLHISSSHFLTFASFSCFDPPCLSVNNPSLSLKLNSMARSQTA